MCTSGINHTSSEYYYAFMDMIDIFCLQQGIDDPIKAYYQRFEAAISTSKLVKCTPTTHMELKIPTWRETMTMSPRGFRWCASSCQKILNNNKGFVTTLRTIPSWVWKITQRIQPPHMTYCAITKSQRHNAKQLHHLGLCHSSIVTMQTAERQSKETMGDNLWILCATAAGK